MRNAICYIKSSAICLHVGSTWVYIPKGILSEHCLCLKFGGRIFWILRRFSPLTSCSLTERRVNNTLGVFDKNRTQYAKKLYPLE